MFEAGYASQSSLQLQRVQIDANQHSITPPRFVYGTKKWFGRGMKIERPRLSPAEIIRKKLIKPTCMRGAETVGRTANIFEGMKRKDTSPSKEYPNSPSFSLWSFDFPISHQKKTQWLRLFINSEDVHHSDCQAFCCALGKTSACYFWRTIWASYPLDPGLSSLTASDIKSIDSLERVGVFVLPGWTQMSPEALLPTRSRFLLVFLQFRIVFTIRLILCQTCDMDSP